MFTVFDHFNKFILLYLGGVVGCPLEDVSFTQNTVFICIHITCPSPSNNFFFSLVD